MKFLASLACATIVAASPVLVAAQDFEAPLKARQGQFRLMAYNLGILGAMAQGKMDYDAEAAATAAGNLVTVSGLSQNHWPAGSDAMSVEGTRAEPAIWDDLADFRTKWQDFGTKAAALQEVAAEGAAGLGPAIGAVGNACKACHEEYRTPEE